MEAFEGTGLRQHHVQASTDERQQRADKLTSLSTESRPFRCYFPFLGSPAIPKLTSLSIESRPFKFYFPFLGSPAILPTAPSDVPFESRSPTPHGKSFSGFGPDDGEHGLLVGQLYKSVLSSVGLLRVHSL